MRIGIIGGGASGIFTAITARFSENIVKAAVDTYSTRCAGS